MDMSYLHSLEDVLRPDESPKETEPTYYYEGICPDTNIQMQLPRTALAEAVASGLMRSFEDAPPSPHEGKMFGVLLVETTLGDTAFLKAFSGALCGASFVEGWVPPLPGHEEIALDEARTLEQLEEMKQTLIELSQRPVWDALKELEERCEAEIEALRVTHRAAKKARKKKRTALQKDLSGEALAEAMAALDKESADHSYERRRLRVAHKEVLTPFRQEVEELREEIKRIKSERKALSRQLQTQMHAVYSLTNFAGETKPLQELAKKKGLPSGTGDCCAPKLLFYAATHGLKPLGMAEFWWGPPPSNQSKQHGTFYGACKERCEPIMGFLLSGLPTTPHKPTFAISQQYALEVLYEDRDMIVVNKPSGLLSVPGRRGSAQDCVLLRARHLFPDLTGPIQVHRLDRGTSGILLLARHAESQRLLSGLFKERKVKKTYEALLCGLLREASGVIELPLRACPERSPLQGVDLVNGKPAQTLYKVLSHEGDYTRIQFMPVTGRTHQLRVHAADLRGLGMPILGDSFYNHLHAQGRLHLHARELTLTHPITSECMHFTAPVPF